MNRRSFLRLTVGAIALPLLGAIPSVEPRLRAVQPLSLLDIMVGQRMSVLCLYASAVEQYSPIILHAWEMTNRWKASTQGTISLREPLVATAEQACMLRAFELLDSVHGRILWGRIGLPGDGADLVVDNVHMALGQVLTLGNFDL